MKKNKKAKSRKPIKKLSPKQLKKTTAGADLPVVAQKGEYGIR